MTEFLTEGMARLVKRFGCQAASENVLNRVDAGRRTCSASCCAFLNCFEHCRQWIVFLESIFAM